MYYFTRFKSELELSRHATVMVMEQIGTAFIHLLSPALDELGSPCLAEGWSEYVSVICIRFSR